MSFETLWAKIANFKKTGELDKVIMAKLVALLPVKQMAYAFLENAANASPEFESDDAFLNWLNDLLNEFVRAEGAHDGLPDRHTGRIFAPGVKVGMSHAEADRVYRESLAGLVAKIRAAPRPPIGDSEAEWIEKQYGVKVV